MLLVKGALFVHRYIGDIKLPFQVLVILHDRSNWRMVAKTVGISFVLARPWWKRPKHIIDKLTRYGKTVPLIANPRATAGLSVIYLSGLLKWTGTDKTKSEIRKTLLQQVLEIFNGCF